MPIVKYTDNLYASEVYRELERQAVKKGSFKPTETELVKLAAQEVVQTQQINREVETDPSDDLIQDVARLAYAMRRKGFINQAEDLEQKLVIFKQAESSLYNVTPESNRDFLDFAHRDGDVNLIDGSGDFGTIETLQSVADKILAVTRKEPTGKLASLAAMITKEAQEHKRPAFLGATREQIGYGAPPPVAPDQSQMAPIGQAQAPQFSVPEVPGTTPTQVTSAPQTVEQLITNANAVLINFDNIRKQLPIQAAALSFDNTIYSDDNKLMAFCYFSGNKDVAGMFRNIKLLQQVRDQGKSLFEPNGLMSVQKVQRAITTEPNIINQLSQSLGLANTSSAQDFVNKYNVLYANTWGQGTQVKDAANAALRKIPFSLYDEIAKIKVAPIPEGSPSGSAFTALVDVARGISAAKEAYLKNAVPIQQMQVVLGQQVQTTLLAWVDSLYQQVVSHYKNVLKHYKNSEYTVDFDAIDSGIKYYEGKDDPKAEVLVRKLEKLNRVLRKVAPNGKRAWIEIRGALLEMGMDYSKPEDLTASLNKLRNITKVR
jgi:hypothetical protein